MHTLRDKVYDKLSSLFSDSNDQELEVPFLLATSFDRAFDEQEILLNWFGVCMWSMSECFVFLGVLGAMCWEIWLDNKMIIFWEI